MNAKDFRAIAILTYRYLYTTLSYSAQAPCSPQNVLQNRHVESIPAPKISGGGIKPVKIRETNHDFMILMIKREDVIAVNGKRGYFIKFNGPSCSL